jgi:hypothetical protein
MSLFDDAIASTASTMNAAGMNASQITAKMISALGDFSAWLATLDVANATRLLFMLCLPVRARMSAREDLWTL